MHLRIKGMNNHELRCLILGLWARLDEDDQQDHIAELNHYSGRPLEEMPPLSQAIAAGEMEP
jgi:hypothetical protein